MLAAVTVASGESKTVLAEQSIINRVSMTIPINEPFYTVNYLRPMTLTSRQLVLPILTTGEVYQHTPKFMNAAINAPVYTLQSDNLTNINIVFGASDRAGKTVQAGEVYEFAITQSYGEVDPAV